MGSTRFDKIFDEECVEWKRREIFVRGKLKNNYSFVSFFRKDRVLEGRRQESKSISLKNGIRNADR